LFKDLDPEKLKMFQKTYHLFKLETILLLSQTQNFKFFMKIAGRKYATDFK